jgi:predicted  nucleic acid-binding Zn-ribbon protein
MRVPPQLITQIHRNSDIVFCPSCQRILCVPASDLAPRTAKDAPKIEA